MNNQVIIDIKEIQKLIPHKPPFLFIDSIIEVDDTKIVGEKKFRKNEFFFKGHYSNYPVVPGVIIVEALAQTAAVFTAKNGYLTNKTGFLAKIQDFSFKRQVTPEETLTLRVMLSREFDSNFFFDAESFYKNELVTRGKFVIVLKEELDE